MGWLNTAGRYARSIGARFPLLGRLREVPNEGLQQALYETLTTILFATMPFWILPFAGFFMFTPKPSLDEAFKNGEGLVYAAVLLGPLFYVLTKRYGRWALRQADRERQASALSMSFPYGTAFVAITALTCVISGFAFALLRKGVGAADIDRAGIETLSWILVVGATVIFFLITAYRNMLDDLAANKAETVIEEQPRSEAAFFDRWLGNKQ